MPIPGVIPGVTGGGGAAHVNVTVTANPAPAAAATHKALEQAIASALNSPVVRKAIADLLNSFSQGGGGLNKSMQALFNSMTAGAKAASTSIAQQFDKVRLASERALKGQHTRGATNELQTLQQHVTDLTKNMNTLANASKQTMQVIDQQARHLRAALRSTDQAARTAALTQTQSDRVIIAGLQKEATQIRATGEARRAAISAIGQITLQAMRSVDRAVRGAFNAATAVVRGFGRTVAGVFRGISQTSQASFRALGNAARAAFRGIAATMRGLSSITASVFRGMVRTAEASFRAMGTLVRGFGRGLAASLRGVSSAFRSAFRRDESELRSSLGRRERALSSSVGRMRGIASRGGGGINLPGLAAVGGIGAAVGTVLTGGFQRFADLERLNFLYTRLLGSEEEAAALMQRISDFARVTPFNLTGVAGLASNFLAMGQSADQAMENITRLADVTAFAGGNTESLERIQRALGQIISTGKLQGDELNQLAENLPGINIRQIIADQMGISTQELVKMQESGELSADAFITAFLTGIDDPRFQGAAEAMSQTLSGRLSNLKETFDILGASAIGLVAGPLTSLFGKATEIIDKVSSFFTGELFEGQVFDERSWSGEPLSPLLLKLQDIRDTLITIRDIVTGDIFKLPEAPENPFADMAPDAEVLVGDLPEEFQRQLAAIGFTGPFVSAEDAAEWWERMNPPPEFDADQEERLETFRKIRETVFDFFKGAGLGLAMAGTFMLIARAAMFLVSPLSLIVIGFGLLNVVWQKMLENSEVLQRAWDGLKAAIGPLIESFVHLGRSILGALFGGDEGGGEDRISFWTKLGDAVGGFIDIISKGLGWITRFVDQIAAFIDIGRADLIDDFLLIKLGELNTKLGDFIGGILGITPAEIAAKGGGIAGLLRNTFLEPVVNFFTDTLPGWARTVGGYISGFWNEIKEVWDAIFGGGDRTAEGAAAAGGGPGAAGSGISERLHDTFLGPILTFFEGLGSVVGTIIGYITSFFSEIWEAWTGNQPGGRTAEGAAAAGGGAGAATETDSWLAATFLDPVVRFFRALPGRIGAVVAGIGDFFSGIWDDLFGRPSEAELTASVIGTAGGVGTAGGIYGPLTPLWNSLTNFKNNVRDLGLGEAFAEVWDGITESASNIWSEGLEPKLNELWLSVVVWFRKLDWGAAISGAAIAAAIGLALAGLPGLVIGILAGFVGGGFGLFDPLLALIDSAWDDSLHPALQRVWLSIVDWFNRTFTAQNLTNWGVDFLGFVSGIGETIGEFFSSDAFTAALIAAAALTGAATAVLAAFANGLAVGLSGAFLDWAASIGEFLGDAFINAAGFANFIPGADAVIAAISDAIEESLGAGGLVILAALGPKIVTGIFAGVTGLPGALAGGAAGLISLMFGRKNIRQIGVDLGKHGWLKGWGAKMAAAIAVGFGEFEFSRAAGRRGGVGNLFLSLLTGVGAGAAIGLQFGPIGAAIGAALGAATGAVGFLFGGMEAKARAAREEVDLLVESLAGLSGEELARTVEQQLRAAVSGDVIGGTALEDWGQLMLDNFDFQGFADDLATGMADADLELVGVIENVQTQLAKQLEESSGLPPEVATDVMNQLVEQMRIAAEAEDFTSVTDLITKAFDQLPADVQQILGPVDLRAVINEALGEGADITIGDLDNILKQATTGVKNYGQAFDEIDTDQAVTGVDTLKEATTELQAIFDRDLGAAKTAAEIRDLINASQLTPDDKIQFIEDAARDAEDALNDARQALIDFLSEETPTADREVILRDFRLEIPDISEQIDTEPIPVGLELDVRADQVGDFEQTVLGIISDAFDADAIRSAADLDQLLGDMLSEVNEAEVAGRLTPAAAEIMRQGIADVQTRADLPGAAGLWEQLLDAEAERTGIEAVAVNAQGIAATKFYDVSGITVPTEGFFEQLLDPETNRTAIETAATGAQDIAVAGFVNPATVKEDAVEVVAKVFDPEVLRPTLEAKAHAARTIYDTALAAAVPTGAGTLAASIIGGSDDSDADTAGSGIGGTFASSIAASQGDAENAAADIVSGVLGEFRRAARASSLYGVAAGRGFARGIGSAGGQAVNNARFIAVGAAQAMDVEGQMYQQGRNAAGGFARGILSRVREVVAAAVLLAVAAIQAVRSVLQSASPSKVFASIGRDVGAGFIEGIEAGQSDMTEALSNALTSAIDAAVEASFEAVNRANVAAKLFDILIPSRLPGGTSNLDVLMAGLSQTANFRGFRGTLNEGAASRFEETSRADTVEAFYAMRNATLSLTRALREVRSEALARFTDSGLLEAREAMLGVRNSIALHVVSMRDQVTEAEEARQALIDYDAALKKINADHKTGANGLRVYRERVAEMNEDVASGAMTAEAMAEQMKILNNQLRLGQLEAEAYQAALDELGDRPAALTYEQLQTLQTGATSLSALVQGGIENREAIAEAIGQIAAWGEAALESGSSAVDVVAQMKIYRDALIAQLTALGFSRAEVLAYVDALGLSDADLKAFIATLTSLNTATAEGAANRESIIDSLNAIREWGAAALETGQSAASVVAEMKKQRDALVAQLTALGFNKEAIAAIVDQLGLSDAALRTYLASLVTLNTATVAGAENMLGLLEQFESIRSFAQTLLAAGVPIADVLAVIRQQRDAIIAQAVAFGFSQSEVEALLATVGLSNAALAEFTAQIAAFEDQANSAAAAAAALGGGGGENAAIAQPGVRDIHVHVPFGDPEAVALATANRMAYDSLTTW